MLPSPNQLQRKILIKNKKLQPDVEKRAYGYLFLAHSATTFWQYSVLAMALCLSVCLSVCICVCHESEFYRNGWTCHTLCCKEIRLSSKIRLLPAGTSSQTLDCKIVPQPLDRRTAPSTSLDEAGCLGHKPVTVSIEVDSTCNGRRSTNEFGLFIALSVYICVQHDAKSAARRAGPSATAHTCIT